MKSVVFTFFSMFFTLNIYSQYNLITVNPYFTSDISGWNYSGDVTATHVADGALTPGAVQITVNTSNGNINNAKMYCNNFSIPDSLRGKMLYFTVFAKGADSLKLRIRIYVFHASGGYSVTKSNYLTLDTVFKRFSIPVNTHSEDYTFNVVLQHGSKTGIYTFDDISMINADINFRDIRQFDNWTPRPFRHPDSVVTQQLPQGISDLTLWLDPGDTVAKVMSTQFGVNSNMRSGNHLVNRSHLYEEFGAFRYPAGSGSNIYFWDGNVPDTFAIDISGISGYYWKFLDPDNFLTFRTNAQGEPTIVVNYFYARYGITAAGTRESRVQQAADYAASWVDYYNIQHNANIKYWEIGNECYGSWEKGYDVNGSIVTGKEYGEDLCVFAQAMKAVDTSIRIGAVLSRQGYEWNNQVMREVGDAADYLIVHHYSWVHNAADANAATNAIQLDIKEVQTAAYMNTDKPKGYFPVCMTEFNLWGDETTNMMNGLFVADALGTMIKSNYDLSTIWVNEWGINGNSSHGILSRGDPKQADYTARPSYTPYYYYGKCFGDYLTGDSLSSESNELKAYSSVFSSGELGVVLLNYSDSTRYVTFDILDGSKPDSIFWYTVYADDLALGNRKFYVNGITSNTTGGGPVNLDDVPAFSAGYTDTSVFKLLPFSVSYVIVKRKTVWTGNSSDNWSEPPNWSTGKAPEIQTNTYIPAAPDGGNFPESNSVASAVCNDLSIENGAHIIVPANMKLTVNGTLSNLSGDSGLVLKADTSGTASLLNNTQDVQATVESYLSQDKWHMVSAPVSDALSEVFVGLYLMYFDETDYTWHYITPLTYDLTEGHGFFAWSSSSATGNATVTYNGTLNNGDISIAGLSYTSSQPADKRGWNMLGNPYPSFINWNGNWTRTNVDATAYIYDGANYLTWNGTTGTHPNGDIAPGQGFWVKANSTGASVIIPQSERKHGTQQFYKAGDNLNELFITVKGNGLTDKILIKFDDKAGPGFDSEYDAWKFKGDESAPQLYTIIGEGGLTVNVLPLSTTAVIPIGLEVGENTAYQLLFNEFELEGVNSVWLEDLKTGQITEVTGGYVYSFSASVSDAAHRFNLHFGNSLSYDEMINGNVSVYSFDSKIYISSENEIAGTVSVYDLTGKVMFTKKVSGNNLYIIPVNLKTGLYIVRLYGEDYVVSQKVYISRK